MIRLQEKWGRHVFNIDHPAYTQEIWNELIRCVRRVIQNVDHKLTGFDKSIIKRQLYHMMFLEEDPSDMFETIAYNDSEYMDEYDGYTGLFVRFVNSGLPTKGVSFNEFLKLPNWLADWLLEWGVKDSLDRSSDTDTAMKEMEKELEAAARKNNANNNQDKFKHYD